MKKRLLSCVVVALCGIAIRTTAQAQVPNLMNYQGRVAVGTVNFDSTSAGHPGYFKFALVDPLGTTTYWRNSPDTTPPDGQPDDFVSLPVTKGLYSVLLGDTAVANMAPITATVFANPDVRLRVWFNDGTNNFQLLTPDQRLAPAAYLSDGAVTSTKLANGAVGTAQLATGAVGSSQLGAGAVISSSIANGAVGTAQLAANAVGTNQIASGAVTNAALATGAVTASKLGEGYLTGSMLDGVLNLSVAGTVSVPIAFSPAYTALPTLTQTPGSWTISNLTTAGFSASVPFTPQIIGSATVSYTSLAVVNGKPAISCFDTINLDLLYSYASSADGSGSWTTVTVDSVGSVGQGSSLKVVNGKPAIAYLDTTNGRLKYAYASTVDGSGSWTTLTVDATTAAGPYASLAVVNGKPAIAYYDQTNADLKYAYASTGDGSGAWTTATVDATGSVGAYCSLAVISGVPAISYSDATNSDLKYAHAFTADGSGTWANLTVDSAGSVGLFTSLAAINGKPAVSYQDNTNVHLKYAYASTADGGGPWTAITVDSTNSSAQWTSLALVNGRPAVSYKSGITGRLKLAYAPTADGSGTWTSVILDSVTNTGSNSSLVAFTGGPAVGYIGPSPGANMKFALIPNLLWAASGFGSYAGTFKADAFSGSLNASNLTGTIAAANLGDGSISSAKIGSGQMVKTLNSLTDNVSLSPGANVTITPSGNTLTIAASSAITGNVSHDATLAGNGTPASLLGIPSGQVVKSLNSLTDGVTLAAGSNITITPSGSTLTINATGTLSSTVSHDTTLTGTGISSSPLALASPLTLPGNLTITGTESFGSTTRQMLNLYGTAYGIGVQNATFYFRTDGSFGAGYAWYAGGSHSNTMNDPGLNGTNLMTLEGVLHFSEREIGA